MIRIRPHARTFLVVCTPAPTIPSRTRQPVGIWDVAAIPYEHGAIVEAVDTGEGGLICPILPGDRLLTLHDVTLGVRPEGPLSYGEVTAAVARILSDGALPRPLKATVARQVQGPEVAVGPRFVRCAWGARGRECTCK